MSRTPSDDPQIRRENEEPSGYRELLGYRLSEWREGYAAIELDVMACHLNRAGVLHGGALASLIDNACGYAATWAPVDAAPRQCVTLSLTVSFAGQVSANRIRAVGRVKGGGRKIIFCAAEVHDETGNLIGLGEGTFRYRTGSERPMP